MRRPVLIALALLSALLLPAAATADRRAIFAECEAGAIRQTHTSGELTDALRNIPTDLDEYYDCRDLIRRARLAAAGGGGGAGADGGSAPGSTGSPSTGAPGVAPATTAAGLLETASPAEQAAVTKAIATGGAGAIDVGGRSVSPDSAGLSPAGAANVVPPPLITALMLLGLGLLAAGYQAIRSLVLARRAPSE